MAQETEFAIGTRASCPDGDCGAGETEVSPGDPVHATDGEIGEVQGFLVSPGDNQVTHVLLKEGHLWGRKKVAIPISAVTGAEEGIKVNLTKKQVEDLPPADLGPPQMARSRPAQ
jgi:hypothetical protein